MHCPRCGQEQVSGVIRFCSRCGFPLEGTIHVLANGGQLPFYSSVPEEPEISPRKKGVKQGVLLLLLGVILVPALGILYGFTEIGFFGFMTAIASILLFVGGPLRMLFAAIFEEGAKRPMMPAPYRQPPPGPASLGQQMRPAALPPPSVTPHAQSWRPQPVTGELVRPPSVTENTTRLLNKDTDRQD